MTKKKQIIFTIREELKKLKENFFEIIPTDEQKDEFDNSIYIIEKTIVDYFMEDHSIILGLQKQRLLDEYNSIQENISAIIEIIEGEQND